MRKLIFVAILLATPCMADEWMPFVTKDGRAKVTSSGVGAVTKPYDLSGVFLTGLPQQSQGGSELLQGGGVVWTGGLNFTISRAQFRIGGTLYESPETNVTLGAADADDDRIDVFAVQGVSGGAGTAVVVAGIPGGPPLEPQIDPSTQIKLTSVIIPEDATAPTITNLDIYLENTEWTSATNAVTITLASTNFPHAGTKDVEGTNVASASYVQFTKPSGTISLGDYTNLVFYIRSKALWPVTKGISIVWMNDTTIVGSSVAFKDNTFGFDSSNTSSYQQIVIPLSTFNAGTTAVNRLRMTVVGSGGTIGWYIDDIILQTGNPPAPPAGGDFSTNVNVAVSGDFVQFSGTTGKLGTDGGLSRTIDGTFASNSDVLIPSQKAVKTYVDNVAGGGAPITAHFLTDRSEAGLSNEVNLGALSSGILYQTVAGSVSTPAIVTIGSGLSFVTGTLSATAQAQSHSITFVVDGSGSVVSSGTKNPVKIPFGGTLTGWLLIGSPSGSVTVDILRAADGAGLPVTSIIGGSGTKPALSSAVENSSTSFTNWTSTTLTAKDNLAISLSGVSTSTYCALTLYYQ